MKYLSKLVLGSTLLGVLSMSAFAAQPTKCPKSVDFQRNAILLDSIYPIDESTVAVYSNDTMYSGKQSWQLVAVTGMADDDAAIQNARASAQTAEGPVERDDYEDFETGSHYVMCTYRDLTNSDDYNNVSLFAFADLSNFNALSVKPAGKNGKVMKTAIQKMLLQHKK